MAEEPPPRVKPRLIGAPRIKELYWCDFPKDAQLPEFWKTRPVIVVSHRNTLHGTVTVVPCSTKEQTDKWAVKLSVTMEGTTGETWAICDKPTTVAVSRLSQARSGKRVNIPHNDFQLVLAKLLEWLPVVKLDK